MTINDFELRRMTRGKRFKPINDSNCMVRVKYVRSQTEQDIWRSAQAVEKMLKGQNVNMPRYWGTGMTYRGPR